MQSCPYNGFSDNRANCPYVPISAPQVPSYPHIVGEGDVASVTLPDGTLQLYFVPARTPPCLGANYQPWGIHPAWFIRTIPNIFPAPAPQPPVLSQHYPLFHEVADNKSGFPLLFHNDQTTSSTDMRYFCRQNQPMETTTWLPKQCAETQVDQPVKLYDVICCKSCHCHRPGRTDTKQPISMSVDGIAERISKCFCNKESTITCSKTKSKDKLVCECKITHEKRETSEKSNQSVRERATQPLNDQFCQTTKQPDHCNDCAAKCCCN